MVDRAAGDVGAGIPSPPELLCRYVLGLRYPDIAYLEALEGYLDARYMSGVGYMVTSFLEWLDPLGGPLEDAPRLPSRAEVDWILTDAGARAAVHLLAPTMGELRIRRPARAALLALAVTGAVEGNGAAGQVAAALAAAGVERDGPKRWRTGAKAGAAAPLRALSAALEHSEPHFLASPWLHARVNWPTTAAALRRSLGHLAHNGLVRRVEPMVTAGVVRRRHLEALRGMATRGDVHLSPLARALLGRRLDRSVKITPGSERGPMADTRVVRSLAAAHLRSADGQGIDCIAEQVVLRQPVRSFSPARREEPTPAPAAERWATRRVDLAMWSSATENDVPSLLLELERPDTSTHAYDRVQSHIEGAMALSSSCARRIDVCFVAHSAIRPRVTATVAGFREQFRLGAAGVWSDANVGVRVIPLGRAQREGLAYRSGDFRTEFHGHRFGRRPSSGVSPVAFLARPA